MDGFFPATDPRLQLYRQGKQWFGSEATLLVVYTESQPLVGPTACAPA